MATHVQSPRSEDAEPVQCAPDAAAEWAEAVLHFV